MASRLEAEATLERASKIGSNTLHGSISFGASCAKKGRAKASYACTTCGMHVSLGFGVRLVIGTRHKFD